MSKPERRERLEYALDATFTTPDMAKEMMQWCYEKGLAFHKYEGSDAIKIFFQPAQKGNISLFFLRFNSNIIWTNFALEEING